MKKQRPCFKSRLFPLGRICNVSVDEIRTLLLSTFKQWGLPLAIRTDNGSPFGVPTRDVIPILSLWLVAWGITPILNRPRRPQDNATVESNQGTASRWAEVDRCQSLEQMQEKLNEVCIIQRDHFPVKRIGKVTRSKVFEDLYCTQRPFEQTLFDEQKAYQYLAQAVYPRKVSSAGHTAIYGKTFQVGLKYKHQHVFVQFDPNHIAWLFRDSKGTILVSIPDPRFSAENLFNLTMCQ